MKVDIFVVIVATGSNSFPVSDRLDEQSSTCLHVDKKDYREKLDILHFWLG
jgi:hypothetical protein